MHVRRQGVPGKPVPEARMCGGDSGVTLPPVLSTGLGPEANPEVPPNLRDTSVSTLSGPRMRLRPQGPPDFRNKQVPWVTAG